jgi:hypothetical protein
MQEDILNAGREFMLCRTMVEKENKRTVLDATDIR